MYGASKQLAIAEGDFPFFVHVLSTLKFPSDFPSLIGIQIVLVALVPNPWLSRNVIKLF